MSKNNAYSNVEVNVSPSCPSIFQTLTAVYQQVGVEQFRQHGRIDPIYKECCLIIAEMYVKSPKGVTRINGQAAENFIVQEVYMELDGGHLQKVVEKFREQGHRIHNKKAYLQTSLYNVMFEFQAEVINDLRTSGMIHPHEGGG